MELARKRSTKAAWAESSSVPIMAMVHGIPTPMTIEGSCILDNTERYAHCEAAMRSGFPVLVGGGNQVFQKPTVLVGSGPSAIALLPEIRQRYERGEEIIAIKGAHDWLLANGIVPRAAIALDPQQSRAKCFKNPRRGILYLCASQMHPDTWEHLRAYQVLVWHSRIEEEQEKRPGWENAFLVPCASTTGNSAIMLLHLMGRRCFELYGFDSSLPRVKTWRQRLAAKVGGRLIKLDGARVARDKTIVEMTVGGSRYETTTELVQQALELEPMLRMLGRVTINAHGDGYYQAILAAGKATGWPV